MVSGTSVTGSTSLAGTNLDTDLSSILQSLGTDTDSYLGSWVSSDDLASYLGTPNQAMPATSLVVQAGEDPDAWVCIPDKTSSQTVAGLESSSWILLDDLLCGLAENYIIPIQSVLYYQPDGSSDAVAYVCLADPQSTMSTLPLDHPLDSFLYTNIPGVSSDLGPGNNLDTAASFSENLSSDPHLDASTQVGSETDFSALNDGLPTNTNIAADSTSDLLTSASSSLGLATKPVDSSPNSSFDVDFASGPSDLSGLGVSPCS